MTMVTATVFAFVVAANLVSVVAEAGLHGTCLQIPVGISCSDRSQTNASELTFCFASYATQLNRSGNAGGHIV